VTEEPGDEGEHVGVPVDAHDVIFEGKDE